MTRASVRKPRVYPGRPVSTLVTDIGNPAGLDVATVLTGSGLTHLLSAGIARYGARIRFSWAELHGISGVVLVGLGVAVGLVLVATGNR